MAACRPSTSEDELRGSGVPRLTGSELRSALEGKVARGRSFDPNSFFYLSFGADGRLEGRVGNSFDEASAASEPLGRDVGTWKARSEDLCFRWSRWFHGRESCVRVYRSGRKFEAFRANGQLSLSFRVDPQNL
jgi:hypothetical protein